MSWAGLLTGPGKLYREAAPFRRRFAFALAVSLTLHAAAVFGVRAGLGAGNPGGGSHVLRARLVGVQNSVEPAEAAAARMEAVEITQANAPRPRETQSAPKAEADNKAWKRPNASGALPLNFIQAGYYYPANSVHKPPVAISDIDFQYPEDSTLKEGMVQARVLINARGSVDEVVVESSEPPGVFDTAAIKALLTGQFSPGLMHGIPVPTQIAVEIRYKDPGSSTLPGVNIAVKKGN